MVVREFVPMAESLVCTELRAPLIVSPVDSSVEALLPSHTSSERQHHIIVATTGGAKLNAHSLSVLTSGLKMMSTLRGAKIRSVDGLSSSLRKSEDDDGYSSRSSLDSPIQATRPDSVVSAAEDTVEMTSSPDVDDAVCRTSVQGCDGTVDEVDSDSGRQSLAAVASLDHTYLTADEPQNTSDNESLTSTECPNGNTEIGITEASSVSQAGCSVAEGTTPVDGSVLKSQRRNISIFVLPQQMTSANNVRWRARIIPTVEASNSQAAVSNGGGVNKVMELSSGQQVTMNIAGSTSRQGGNIATTWLPISSIATLGGQRPGTVFTTRPTQVAPRGPAMRSTLLPTTVSGASASGLTSARTATAYMRTVAAAGNQLIVESPPVYRCKESLHPLVDHDYGAFATFNAEIQSSIISTTADGISQNDWRNIRRYRAARAKVTQLEASMVAPVDGSMRFDVPLLEVRPKRKYCRRQPVARAGLLVSSSTSSLAKMVSKSSKFGGRKGRPPSIDAARRGISVVRNDRKRSFPTEPPPSTDSDSKNYVKIPGHYQDDFVYYAPKRTRGRPRKHFEPTGAAAAADTSATTRPTAVGGINVFDWYREMAQTDKSTRFGAVTSASTMSTSSAGNSVTWSSSQLLADTSTPVDESAVADLVMEMLPRTDLEALSAVTTASSVAGVFSSGPSTTYSVAGDRGELTVTEEDVCAMIRTLSEADLKMLASHLTGDDEHKSNGTDAIVQHDDKNVERVADTTLSQYFTEYSRDSLLNLSQTSQTSVPSGGLLDVDDINDGDLLTADIANMNVLLRDLDTPSRDVRTSNLPVTSKTNLSALFDPDYLAGSDFSAASQTMAPSVVTTVMNSAPTSIGNAPPELCVVNMFWNDLPGLRIESREYVRLVDIHRQVLPAKDTGILKKRCHMLGLEIRQCSELQRDFLVRYMNAAKSKSTVVVSQADAVTLIGFYVNPKSRSVRAGDAGASVDVTLEHGSECGVQQSSATLQQQQHQLSSCGGSTALMTQQLLYTSPAPSISTAAAHNRLTQSDNPVSSKPTSMARSTAPQSGTATQSGAGGVKRSERLRDRRIRYADMVLGVHHRHNSTSDDEADSRLKSRHTVTAVRSSTRPAFIVPGGGTKRSRLSSESVTNVGRRLLPGRRRATFAADENRNQATPGHSIAGRKSVDGRPLVEKRSSQFAPVSSVSAPTCSTPTSPNTRRASLMRSLESGHTTSCDKNDKSVEMISSESFGTEQQPIPGAHGHERLLIKMRRAKRFLSRRGRRRFSTIWKQQSINSSTAFGTTSSTLIAPQSLPSAGNEERSVDGVKLEALSAKFVETEKSSAGFLVNNSLSAGVVQDATSEHASVLVVPDVSSAVSPSAKSSTESLLDTTGGRPAPRGRGALAKDVKLYLKSPVQNVVPVSHCSLRCRSGRKRRPQLGAVLLKLYTSRDAPCVRCATCRDIMSVAEFAVHLHADADSLRLVPVTAVQRIGPDGPVATGWAEFHHRLATFSASDSSDRPVEIVKVEDLKSSDEMMRVICETEKFPEKVEKVETSKSSCDSSAGNNETAARVTRSASIRAVELDAPPAARTRHHSTSVVANAGDDCHLSPVAVTRTQGSQADRVHRHRSGEYSRLPKDVAVPSSPPRAGHQRPRPPPRTTATK